MAEFHWVGQVSLRDVASIEEEEEAEDKCPIDNYKLTIILLTWIIW
jgi:hypothetical protein